MGVATMARNNRVARRNKRRKQAIENHAVALGKHSGGRVPYSVLRKLFPEYLELPQDVIAVRYRMDYWVLQRITVTPEMTEQLAPHGWYVTPIGYTLDALNCDSKLFSRTI